MLDMFFDPQAVAVIGASRTPGKLGHSVLQNVLQYGYTGAIYPINPGADEILGLKCFPGVLVVPGPIDLAVILIPSKHVIRALIECGEKGVKGAIVISAGFREMIREIQGHNLLRGVHGERPSDLDALAEALLRLSQLVADFPDIVGFDINPLIVFEEGRGVMGIDMRLVLE